MGTRIDGLSRLIGGSTSGREVDQVAAAIANMLGPSQVWDLFERATSKLSLALCLHRVSRVHRDELTMPAHEIDSFLERACDARRAERPPRITITFDDGYDDACYYVESRAVRFPYVEWLLFVCPAKAERRVGFRWDLDREDQTPRDVLTENDRLDLRSVVRLHDTRLATVEECRRMQLVPNADIGNHTNCHFRAADLDPVAFREEVQRSGRDFARLFGPQRHFAFPFGAPEKDFDARHVRELRAAGDFLIWTTARRPYLPEQRVAGAVLPRFPVNGAWSAAQLAFWIGALSLRARARGIGSLYPARPEASVAELVTPDGAPTSGTRDVEGGDSAAGE